MKSFRLAIDASVCITIEAETYEEADAQARQILIENTEGIDIDLSLPQGTTPEEHATLNARLYFNESATDNIHVEDIESIDALFQIVDFGPGPNDNSTYPFTGTEEACANWLNEHATTRSTPWGPRYGIQEVPNDDA